jgi:tetratricopeptide (TPR) repeat protein
MRTTNLIVAFSFTAGAVLAQSEGTGVAREEQLRGQIAALQSETGLARPAEIVDPLRALATLHEETGDHAFAAATLEEARYVARIHYGLASAEEALLLRQQIRNEKALGLHQRVWDLEQDMTTIAPQNHDDLRMVQVFRYLAEDRREALDEYRAGGFPPEIELGCYYVPRPIRYDDTRGDRRPPPRDANSPPDPTSCIAGNRDVVIKAIRSESLMYYADAIQVIVKNGDYASQELRDLERQALRATTFAAFAPSFCRGTVDDLVALPLIGSCLEPVFHDGDTVIPNIGWASLVRLLAYEIRSGAPPAARANALAELADWHLVAPGRRFDEQAFGLYERAYRVLEDNGDTRTVTGIFSPKIPITLLAYEPNPFVPPSTAEASRYMDVAFEITKQGVGRRVRILDTSAEATRNEERHLTRLIENTTFRPRMVNGKLADEAPAELRYYLP